MTQDPPSSIHAPLQRLAELGLARPEHLTVEQYLRVLVQGDLLARPPVDAYLELFQAVRYGDEEPDPARVERAMELLGSEVDLLADMPPEMFRSVKRELIPPRPALASPAAPEAPPPDLSAQIPRVVAPEPPSPPEPPRRGWHALPSLRLVIPVVILLLAWSGVMIAFGYSRADRIEKLVKWVKRRGRPAPAQPPAADTPEKRLERLRSRAGAAAQDRRLWIAYAMVAYNQHQYAEAIWAYNRTLDHWGDDPKWKKREKAMVLNNLAWLHLTATRAYALDPVRGLKLAERAFALSREPYITDTLAEACYQNSQFERAVKLERDALARASKRQKGIFEKSLQKYEEALLKLSSGASP